MMSFRQARCWTARIGRRGEKAAATYLEDNFFEILLRNCRTPNGEIDLIARDGATMVFTEVKTLYSKRGSVRETRPAENLKDVQRRRIYRAAMTYLAKLDDPAITYRFDVVEVILDFLGVKDIRHHRAAFGFDRVHKRRAKIY